MDKELTLENRLKYWASKFKAPIALECIDRIAELEQQLSDLKKSNSEIKAQGIREAVSKVDNTVNINNGETIYYYSAMDLLGCADNLIKGNKGE